MAISFIATVLMQLPLVSELAFAWPRVELPPTPRSCRPEDCGHTAVSQCAVVVLPQKNTQGSDVIGKIDPSANVRKTRMGSMTHFGLTGDGSLDACAPPETCGETTSRSWDPDLTGPYNHAEYGGWYLSFDHGTPAHLSVQRMQLETGSVLIEAMSVPAGTNASSIRVYGESYTRVHDYTPVSSVQEVREAEHGDVFFFDTATDLLYWRVIAGYVANEGDGNAPFGWIGTTVVGDDEAAPSSDPDGVWTFSRGGLSIVDTTTKNQFQLHIKISCETHIHDAFCITKPAFNVPAMGCADGDVMVAIDQCGPPCQLDDSCELVIPPECQDVCNPKKRQRGRRKFVVQ
eukprot:gene10216-3050_t